MRTRAKLEQRFARLIEELDALARTAEFDEEDPLRFVRDAAALWERSLKRCTLTAPPKNPTLNNLIDATASDGVDAATRAAMHELRRAANQGKHDPSRLIGSAEARRLIQASTPALGQLDAAGVPELATTAAFGQRRRYLIAVYDHYHTGETEYDVYLVGHAPSRTEFRIPIAVETFSVNFAVKPEPIIKAQLAATGEATFTEREGADFWKALNEDDFVAAWEWEGSHRDLVTAFAPHQWHADVLPGLSRADHVPSVISAAALALVEIARPASWKDVLWKMSTDFGIWRRGTVVEEIARAAVSIVGGTVDRDLYGPRWVAKDDAMAMAAATQRFERDGFVLGIDGQGVVVVGFDLGLRGVSIEVLDASDLERPPDPSPDPP